MALQSRRDRLILELATIGAAQGGQLAFALLPQLAHCAAESLDFTLLTDDLRFGRLSPLDRSREVDSKLRDLLLALTDLTDDLGDALANVRRALGLNF